MCFNKEQIHVVITRGIIPGKTSILFTVRVNSRR